MTSSSFGVSPSGMVLSAPIPDDLVEEIVSHLRSDVAALKSCSTVAHAFHPPSRKLLFSLVILDTPRSVTRLHDLLNDAPSISALIRTLHMRIIFTTDDMGAIFLSISLRLPHLQYLTIGPIKRFAWSELSKIYVTALETLVSSTNLRRLELSHIFLIPFSFIIMAKRIRALLLRFVIIKNDITMTDKIPFTQLEALDVGRSVQFTQANLLTVPKLCKLSIRGIHRPSLECAFNFISSTSETIGDFVWRDFGGDEFVFSNLVFEFPLGVRRLGFQIPNHWALRADTWSLILDQLEGVPVARSLEILTIEITATALDELLQPQHLSSLAFLTKIDYMLANTSHFPRLTKLEFALDRTTFPVLTGLRKIFPDVSRANLLKISVDADSEGRGLYRV